VTMMLANFGLRGISPYSQSRPVQSPKIRGELDDAFERRTWRERIHADEKGCYIPPMAIKNLLTETAEFLGERVRGKGQATYTKHFKAGILVIDPIYLDIPVDKIEGERLFLNADGRRGGGKRVWRIYPKIPAGWRAEGRLFVVDPVLIDNMSKIKDYLEHGGQLIGIGRFRPINNGFYGRFAVESWSVQPLE
jgi:hypothetical protein